MSDFYLGGVIGLARHHEISMEFAFRGEELFAAGKNAIDDRATKFVIPRKSGACHSLGSGRSLPKV